MSEKQRRMSRIPVKSIMSACKGVAQHILRPLFDLGGLHRSSPEFLQISRRHGTRPGRVRLKPRCEIIRNLRESFFPCLRRARIYTNRAFVKIEIFPPEFVNLLWA